ncbi:extracellular calcium-sensing receptor-like [Ambystoma mexicanum]|uniref:extracellular calcium-sensing receptor-like n=1 Tax=Ambystoma mexicanum TaxID=8296 RepID=UPI0037E8DDE4
MPVPSYPACQKARACQHGISCFRQLYFTDTMEMQPQCSSETRDVAGWKMDATAMFDSRFSFQNYQWLQAMSFAIEKINRTPGLLPNITLGFRVYDSCAAVQHALEGTLCIMSQEAVPIPNYQCNGSIPTAAIVGDSSSTRSILMARILGLQRYPQPLFDDMDHLGIVYTNYADDTQILLPLTGDYRKDSALVNKIYSIVQAWMATHSLCLNDDKTELLILGTASLIKKLNANYSSFIIDENCIQVAKEISYFSTNPLLSDRNQFPSFFRTIPSDDFQSLGLAQLLIYFGWTWVGFLAEDTDYGQQGIQILQAHLAHSQTCIAFSESILTNVAHRNAFHIVQVIKRSTANVIVTFSNDVNLVPILEELMRWNVTGKIWVASEAWSTSTLFSMKKYSGILSGAIGFAIHSGEMPGFQEHLAQVHPSKSQPDVFITRFWEEAFGCKWIGQKAFNTARSNQTKLCTGAEELGSLENIYNDVQQLTITYNVYIAVYAIAYALHDLNSCINDGGPFPNGSCADISDFDPWQIMTSENAWQANSQSEVLHMAQQYENRVNTEKEKVEKKKGDLKNGARIGTLKIDASSLKVDTAIGSGLDAVKGAPFLDEKRHLSSAARPDPWTVREALPVRYEGPGHSIRPGEWILTKSFE